MSRDLKEWPESTRWDGEEDAFLVSKTASTKSLRQEGRQETLGLPLWGKYVGQVGLVMPAGSLDSS